jgi:hypothetical protein
MKNKILVLSLSLEGKAIFNLEISSAETTVNSIAFVKRSTFTVIPGL